MKRCIFLVGFALLICLVGSISIFYANHQAEEKNYRTTLKEQLKQRLLNTTQGLQREYGHWKHHVYVLANSDVLASYMKLQNPLHTDTSLPIRHYIETITAMTPGIRRLTVLNREKQPELLWENHQFYFDATQIKTHIANQFTQFNFFAPGNKSFFSSNHTIEFRIAMPIVYQQNTFGKLLADFSAQLIRQLIASSMAGLQGSYFVLDREHRFVFQRQESSKSKQIAWLLTHNPSLRRLLLTQKSPLLHRHGATAQYPAGVTVNEQRKSSLAILMTSKGMVGIVMLPFNHYLIHFIPDALLEQHSPPIFLTNLGVLLFSILLMLILSWYIIRFLERQLQKDIEELRASKIQLEHLASYDTLTELPNRAEFDKTLRRAVSIARRSHRLFALLLLDVDKFKSINDRLGHPVGDLLLKKIATALKENTRTEDFVARVGGDEFAIILSDLKSPYFAGAYVKKMLSAMQTVQRIEGSDIHIELTVGICVYDPDGDPPDSVVKAADIALYRAKEVRGSGYQYYSVELNEEYNQKLAMEHDLQNALQRGEFFLVYQPKYSLTTNRVTGMEALIRWRHPEKGIIFPDSFIRIAEEIGFILPIGLWVVQTACQQFGKWYEQLTDKDIIFSLNISPLQLADLNLIPLLKKSIEKANLPFRNVEIEFTETALMTQVAHADKVLDELYKLGVRISIDDFGTGYSALSRLKDLPVNTLKIDQSFIKNLLVDDKNTAIVKSIILLARYLNLDVVAEGVETEAQEDFLRQHECAKAQGYRFSKPVAQEDMNSLLGIKGGSNEG